ncbi:hypothetical protein SO802_022866 [Lithocarpus litseifolius]|uniref:Uncharacterized protein n=1 Tax=Lithocarpus litseifolius TaxID=425828 RepID=A0AAW2C634_9ROSI
MRFLRINSNERVLEKPSGSANAVEDGSGIGNSGDGEGDEKGDEAFTDDVGVKLAEVERGHGAVLLGRGFDLDFGSSTGVGRVPGSPLVQLLVGLVGGGGSCSWVIDANRLKSLFLLSLYEYSIGFGSVRFSQLVTIEALVYQKDYNYQYSVAHALAREARDFEEFRAWFKEMLVDIVISYVVFQ